jgi:hypothetical protein
MKLTFSLVALVFLFCNNAYSFDPVKEFTKNGEEIAKRFEITGKEINDVIKKIEKVVQLNGPTAQLTPKQTHQITASLTQCKSVLSPVITYYLRGINHALQSTQRDRYIADRFLSTVALAGGLVRNIDEMNENLSTGASAAFVLGRLKSFRFTIHDTIGNLLLTIERISLEQSVGVVELSVLRSVYSPLRSSFAQVYKSILKETPHSYGDRNVSYVNGSTMTFSTTEEPFALPAHEALKIEIIVAQNLANSLNANEKHNKKLGRYTKLKTVTQNCSASLQ